MKEPLKKFQITFRNDEKSEFKLNQNVTAYNEKALNYIIKEPYDLLAALDNILKLTTFAINKILS